MKYSTFITYISLWLDLKVIRFCIKRTINLHVPKLLNPWMRLLLARRTTFTPIYCHCVQYFSHLDRTLKMSMYMKFIRKRWHLRLRKSFTQDPRAVDANLGLQAHSSLKNMFFIGIWLVEIRFVTLQYISHKYLHCITVRSYTILNTETFSKQGFKKKNKYKYWVPQRTFRLPLKNLFSP